MNYQSQRNELERVRKLCARRGFKLNSRPRGAAVEGVNLPRYQLVHSTLGTAFYYDLPEDCRGASRPH